MSELQGSDLTAIAEMALDGARQRGYGDVRIAVSRGRTSAVTYRQRKVDKVQESALNNLALHLYDHGKYSVSETNDLRPAAIEQFLDSASALCRAMAEDPFRMITDPSLYRDREERDLHLFDDSIHRVPPEERRMYAAHLEAEALEAAGPKVISVEATFEDSESELVQLHSNGFAGTKKGTRFSAVAEVTLEDEGDKRPAGFAEASSRSRSDLPYPDQLGRRAAEAAAVRLRARKLDTGKMAMIVENRAALRLVAQLLRAMSGRALQQRASFLDGKINKHIGSPLLEIIDDPFIDRGFGSRLFDGEGISAKKMTFFDQGVLCRFYIDTYYGKKLGMAPTTGAHSNVVFQPGGKNLHELVAAVHQGVLVRGFLGGNSNPTTGDFSLGVYGTLIERGQLRGAVAEINIAGRHTDLWHRLVDVGNDPYPYSAMLIPSLVFDGVQFAGA